MRKIIRLDDATSHGGKVLSVAATHFTVGGVAVARVGDRISCPVHGPGSIVEGEARHTVDGVPVAYEGHKTSCGAMLLPSDPHLTCP
ncbi:PAAR domain-containing protein [Massilia oculi]|uniref:PAAR domain-containing protein n=1 Tax=Massilia hydrophila TaxID=3044279 RepID=A0ABS7YDP3_9BURK|nr:PAAR domain-containing protein [Massilia oculi]MCA1857835.1 PAAR domain-containing protein [Massilia oculi]